MKNDYIIYGILAVAVIILAYTIFGLFALQNNQNAAVSGFMMISTGSTEPGSAQVDLTPKGVINGQLNVDFTINTHSVDLSQYDLAKITVLEHDGRKILPTAAPKLEGHHSSGTLIFNVGESLNNFKIIIKGVPDIEERVFEWR